MASEDTNKGTALTIESESDQSQRWSAPGGRAFRTLYSNHLPTMGHLLDWTCWVTTPKRFRVGQKRAWKEFLATCNPGGKSKSVRRSTGSSTATHGSETGAWPQRQNMGQAGDEGLT